MRLGVSAHSVRRLRRVRGAQGLEARPRGKLPDPDRRDLLRFLDRHVIAPKDTA
jgi:hypothetical protein